MVEMGASGAGAGTVTSPSAASKQPLPNVEDPGTLS